MYIENWSAYHFMKVSAYAASGYITSMPLTVKSCHKEKLTARKHGGTATGTWGVIKLESHQLPVPLRFHPMHRLVSEHRGPTSII